MALEISYGQWRNQTDGVKRYWVHPVDTPTTASNDGSMATHLDARKTWQIFKTLGLSGCYEFSYKLKGIQNPAIPSSGSMTSLLAFS